MDDVIIVTVSYWYRGKGWIDPRTQIEFKGDQKGLPITISKSKDLSGIKRSIMLNNLILLEGDLGEPGVANLEKILFCTILSHSSIVLSSAWDTPVLVCTLLCLIMVDTSIRINY